VYRKCQDDSLDAFEQQREAHTVTVGVVKNKRPPCKTGHVDLFIHPDWGAIRPLREGDRYELPENDHTAQWEAWKAQQEEAARNPQLPTIEEEPF
jgi:hypothetical protein